MKVIDIPAYSYFAGSSYRTDIFYICDDALLETYDALFPDSSVHTIWSESGGNNYVNVWRVANQKLGAPVFSPNYRFYQVWNNNTSMPPSWYSRVISDFGITLDDIKITDNYSIPSASSQNVEPDSLIALNGDTLGHGYYHLGNIKWNTGFAMGSNTVYNRCYFTTSLNSITVNIEVCIYPEGLFKNGVIIDQTTFENDYPTVLKVFLSGVYSVDGADLDKLKSFQVRVQHVAQRNSYLSLKNLLINFHTANSGVTEKDFDDTNPYGTDGNSETGGGDGTLTYGGLDYIDPTEIPEIPTLSAANCGFMTIYNPSVSQLQSLADFMWSGAFDLDTYKKLFSDPMESIIGLAIVPVAPDIGGAKNVMFGTIDSGVNMSYVSSQYKKVNCGSVDIQKYIGCFMDYSPYTKISIYLPYIGIRDLSPDDITGGSINVTYIVDVLSGSCACFISHSVKGVLYAFNGSCISNIPLTASNFSGAIQNAVSAVIGGVGVIAGMATGAAPVTAMGAMGLLNSAANTAMNSKPHIQRSGNLGGSAGIMSVQKPFIIIERPNLSVPSNVQHYVGQTSNLTRNLGNCSGFTMVEYIHLHDIPATSEELTEIETLLKQGVIL